MTELKSLKNPTRILTALMFIAFIIYSIGLNGLQQALPFVPEVIITAIFGAATFLITQYGTEKRVIRAEELRDEVHAETQNALNSLDNLSEIISTDEEEVAVGEDGV